MDGVANLHRLKGRRGKFGSVTFQSPVLQEPSSSMTSRKNPSSLFLVNSVVALASLAAALILYPVVVKACVWVVNTLQLHKR